MGKSHRQSYFSNSPLKGFTLIELLTVIAVIGVLATVLIIAINPVKQLQKARDTRRKADIAKIQQALEMYRSDNNSYPNSVTCGASLTGSVNGSTVTYLQSVPCDPTNSAPYLYNYTLTNPVQYKIVACLENATDAQADPPAQKDPSCPAASYTQQNP